MIVKTKKLSAVTTLILLGICISYVCQMAPSPFLSAIKADYGIWQGDAAVNLSLSAMYPTIILASLLGSRIERRFGTYTLYTSTLFLLSLGLLMNYFAATYALFLLGRAVYGAGFGLGIPFIGSAIVQLYNNEQRKLFNIVNALFPFVGTFICFALLLYLSERMHGGWRASIGIWGCGAAVILLLWLLTIDRTVFSDTQTHDGRENGNVTVSFVMLLQRREIKYLCLIFTFDFFCYSYVVTILPTMLMERCGIAPAKAGLLSSLVLPAVGAAGCMLCGCVNMLTKSSKRTLAIGILCEVAGLLLCTLLGNAANGFVYCGIALYAFGNGLWFPNLYQIPMDLSGITAREVGASFALMSTCAFISGFFSPFAGGALADAITVFLEEGVSNAHAMGLRWSLFLMGLVDFMGLFFAVRLEKHDEI